MCHQQHTSGRSRVFIRNQLTLAGQVEITDISAWAHLLLGAARCLVSATPKHIEGSVGQITAALERIQKLIHPNTGKTLLAPCCIYMVDSESPLTSLQAISLLIAAWTGRGYRTFTTPSTVVFASINQKPPHVVSLGTGAEVVVCFRISCLLRSSDNNAKVSIVGVVEKL